MSKLFLLNYWGWISHIDYVLSYLNPCFPDSLFDTICYWELQEREIPEDDPRLLQVSRMYENLRERFGTGPGRP